MKRYHKSNQNQMTQKNTELDTPQYTQKTKHNKQKLTLIWSYPYDPRHYDKKWIWEQTLLNVISRFW